MVRQSHAFHLSPVVLGILWAGASLCFAADATQPAGGPNGAAQTGPVPGAMPPGMLGQTSPAGGAQGVSGADFPAGLVVDWIHANTIATQTRAIYRQSQGDLAASVRRAELRFRNSQDYQNALNEDRQAYEDYNAARKHAAAALTDNARYQSIVSLRDEAGAKLARLRANKHPNKDQLLAMAQLKMEYASDARAIESQVMENDPAVRNARDRMIAAGRRVSELRKRLDEALRDDPELEAARKSVKDSRIAMLTAETYANSTAQAADAAVFYQFYLHRMDQGYYAPWGPAATTGTGYSSPYWVR